MKIQVLGSGCATCKNLYELTKKAVEELGLKDTVEYITDITKIIEMGVMTSPLIAIDGQPALIGSTSDIDRIKDLLTIKSNGKTDEKCCDDNCCEDDCCKDSQDKDCCKDDCCSKKPVASTCPCSGNC